MSSVLKSRLARMARITAKIALGLAACIFLVVLICVIVNSFDAPLSEQAKDLLTLPPNPYPADDNIYLGMAGLEGPGERPIIAIGRERIDAYNRALDSMLLNPEVALELNKKWDAASLAFSGKLELGSPRTGSIWAEVKTHRQDIAATLASNPILYQRYLSMHHLHGYYETALPSHLAPPISAPREIRVLFLGDVANRIQTGTLQQQREALADLQCDLQLWRALLKGEGTLISKMLAAAFLHADLTLLADMIADPSTELSSLYDVLEPLASPFEPKDYRIGNAFPAEFRGTATLYRSITDANASAGSASSWLERTWNAFQAHFFKLNATENMSAAHAAHWAALADSEPSLFIKNREANRAWLKDHELHFSPGILYNPIGKILVAIAAPQNDAYSLRVYDVAAYQRLVYLSYQLKRQHIATADVAAFLNAHPDWSTHPVDGKPFRWNPETRELAVSTLGEHSMAQRFSAVLR
jgi:hypothetical protein